MEKSLICKICGLPRMDKYSYPLCEQHYKEYRALKYLKEKDIISEKSKIYRAKNKEAIKSRGVKYRKANKDKIKERKNPLTWKKWANNNPDYKKNRWKVDENYRIKENLRGRMYKAFKGLTKCKSSKKLLGCTIEELKTYLSNLFIDDMSFNNYGEWHIDHIKPCSLFDLSKPEEQEKCFHYTNLQPLWAKDNLIKSAKYEKFKIS